MGFQATNDFVLVKLVEPTMTSKGGIIVGIKIDPPPEGIVISVGKGKVLPNGTIAEHNINVGDHVIFGKSALNVPMEDDDGTKLYVMKIEEIFGKKV